MEAIPTKVARKIDWWLLIPRRHISSSYTTAGGCALGSCHTTSERISSAEVSYIMLQFVLWPNTYPGSSKYKILCPLCPLGFFTNHYLICMHQLHPSYHSLLFLGWDFGSITQRGLHLIVTPPDLAKISDPFGSNFHGKTSPGIGCH